MRGLPFPGLGSRNLTLCSTQQYKAQFNKWGWRKNKRRIDQRASSPETGELLPSVPVVFVFDATRSGLDSPCDGKEEPARRPPPPRSTDQVPDSSNTQIDLGMMGASSATTLPHSTNSMGGTQNFGQTIMGLHNMGATQAFWQDPFQQSGMNLNLQSYGNQYAFAYYAQVSIPTTTEVS